MSRTGLAAALAACVSMAVYPAICGAESMYVYGIHNWNWGANIDVMSGLTGWCTEADLSRSGPNVGGRYAPMNAEGFTVVQRLDWEWGETIPLNPADYATFANNCRYHWARNIKDYCRHYSIGNEVDLTDVTSSQYVACFRMVRDAIKAEQPNARVLVGHWCNTGSVESVISALGPGGYDGLTAHTGSSVPTDLLSLLDQYGAPDDVGVYITEWGWVTDSNPNAQAVMMQFCQDVDNWNATHVRQVYSATYYRYPCWDSTFHLQAECSTIDNPAFRYMTANCAATNRYANDPVIISNPRVEVSTSDEDLVARWETNLPSKTMVWYWHASRPNGEFMPLQTSLVYDHSIPIHNDLWLWPNSEYQLVCRSPAWDLGDGSLGPLLVTTGPWTVSADDVTETSATIRWQTLFPSTSRVEYGETIAYGNEQTGPDGVTEHVVHLTELRPWTTYHYRVWSEADGYIPHHSEDLSFQTAVPGGPFIEVWPTRISADAWVLTGPPNDSFNLRNGGVSGAITYTITPDCPWLAAVPDSGTSSGETDVITITYDTTGLPAGEHVCPITITAPEAYNSPVSSPIVTLNLATVAPDFDGDGDVDQKDFGLFQVCLGAPGVRPAPACEQADLENDGDVDLSDFGVLQGCLSGTNVAPDPDCAG